MATDVMLVPPIRKTPRPQPTPTGPGLIAASAPPLRLPGEHFAAALCFWVAGALGLVWIAPDLARGLFPLPRVIAVTHLFTLGWITTTIQGALYQFMPVALGTPVRSERAAHISFLLYVPGLAAFVLGLATVNHDVLLLGAAAFGSGLLVFLGNLYATLRRCTQRDLTWWALTGAGLSLLMTIVLGISLAGNLRWSYLGPERFLAVGVHMHVAVAGWVMLVIVGVARRLLPMFLVSHGASPWPNRVSVACLGTGTALLVALHHGLSRPLAGIIAALLAGGVLAFVNQAVLYFRHRRRPNLDPGLRLAAAGLVGLCAAVVLAPFVLWMGTAAPRIATAYAVVLILGGLSLFVAGHYYKILPFLIWFHRFGPLAGKQILPGVSDLYSARVGNIAAALLSGGVAVMTAAILAGEVTLTRIGAVVFTLGGGTLASQMMMLARTKPRTKELR